MSPRQEFLFNLFIIWGGYIGLVATLTFLTSITVAENEPMPIPAMLHMGEFYIHTVIGFVAGLSTAIFHHIVAYL
ncbi:MAG: hypothetical protein HYW90_04130 [Candidatus Sungbacteria bacterium]|nr:hypothetical protein [Candidatus Sungbacteria bacterium]